MLKNPPSMIDARRQSSAAMFLTRVSSASPLDVSGSQIRMTGSRLIVGLITSHRTCLTIMKTCKGRPRPDLGCSATDDSFKFI
jgi:hypothetical protein